VGRNSLPWLGLVLGTVMGFAFLVAGTVTLLPDLFVLDLAVDQWVEVVIADGDPKVERLRIDPRCRPVLCRKSCQIAFEALD
jgi:hypothetical protein